MPSRSRPGVAAAVKALRDLVNQYRREGMDALPSVAELVPRLGVSHATTWKAIRVLCEEGVLRTKRGSGTYIVKGFEPGIPKALPPEPPTEGLGSRWESVRDQIVADYLVSGAGQREALPNGKVLVSRYGASYRTVRRALASLASDGRLVAQGRQYAIVYSASHHASRCVILISPGRVDNAVAFRYPNEQENLRWLEKECSGRGIVLRVLTYSLGSRTLGPPEQQRRPVTHDDLRTLDALGYMLWLPGSPGTAVPDVLSKLPPEADPVAVATTQAYVNALATARFNRRVRLYSSSTYGKAAGEAVAQYLIARGHRRVVYIAPHTDEQERSARFVGMMTVFQAAGVAVHQSTFAVPARQPRGRRRPEFGVLTEFVRLSRERMPETTRVRQMLDAIIASREQVRYELEHAHRSAGVRAALDAVPASLSPTAVVAFNDDCAKACLEVFHERRVRIPDNVSLISFDDTALAALHDITSYNFNESRVLLSMLDWVLWPGMQRGRSIEPPPAGFVTQRGTVRSVVCT